MTAREIKIAKKVLDYLHAEEGPVHLVAIHAEIGGLTACSTSELDDVIAALDRDRCIIGVPSKYKGTLWSISDRGESERRKM